MEKYLDKTLSPKERAADLLSKLSPEEKLAQTQCVLVPLDKIELAGAFLKYGMGEISTLEVRNIDDRHEAAAFQRKIQKMVMESSPHHIPAIFHMEGLCGAFIQDATSFPSGIARASGFHPELERKIGEVVARQENAAGITHILAPVLDISRDSRMGRQGETYGEDPALASAMGSAYTKGIQETTLVIDGDERHAEAVAKHFMGFHNSLGGIHGGDSMTTPRLMEEIYGRPFQAAISEAHLRGVMPCYCTFDGEPASASGHLLTDILRDKMKFDGLAVSDYSAVMNVHQVQKAYETLTDAGEACMRAGMDVEMPIPTGYNAELLERFKSGTADMNVLDTAVLRILEAKFRMGLFEHPYALEGEAFDREFFRDEDQRISLQSATESLVLLKNNGVLPLDNTVKKIAVIGPHAANARDLFGGYTHISMVEAVHAVANSIAGIGDAASNRNQKVKYVPGTQIQSNETEEFEQILRTIKPGCRNLLEELREAFPDAEIEYAHGYAIAGADESEFEEALEKVRNADVCILTLGGKHGSCSVASMGEGVDATDINLPSCQDRFIAEAAKTGTSLIGVHFNGRPISSDVADEKLDAILEAWNPSEAGARAIVNVLKGEENPSGRLPVCVAYCAGQLPIFYNHANGTSWHQGKSIGFANYVDMPHTPRYYFGYGLSYTTFEYSDLKTDRESMSADGSIQITVKVQNTGKVAGTDVVQMYVRDVYASMVRPEKELGGFVRVTLAPGETKMVKFTWKASQIAFLTSDMKWKVEKGAVDIMIGKSCNEILLSTQIQIDNDAWIEGAERSFYAQSEVVESC